ncbi:MAG: NAD(P)H-binding protein [Chloroflexota bacterium]|nr:NAD(P)H-binding protein [Chloroflexota bacterium]
MPHPERAVVTGAFGYTGRHVARRLLDLGVRVRTLTRRRDRADAFGGRVEVAPADFTDRAELRGSLEGADVLYNTYWVRFARGQTTFNVAVKNSKTLFEAAADAGVGKIVHFSVTNAASDSRLPYFKGKGQVEESLQCVGVPYAIIRPTLVFGDGDILINNIAWALRRFPVFPVYGGGDYPVQPVYAGDLATQAVAAGSHGGNSVSDAAGPDTMSFASLLRLVTTGLGLGSRLVHISPSVAFALTGLVGLVMRDVVLTRDEIAGLMAGLLTSDAPPTGSTSLSSWIRQNADGLGRKYVSELGRNWRPFGQ